jgi:hypothetical protein
MGVDIMASMFERDNAGFTEELTPTPSRACWRSRPKAKKRRLLKRRLKWSKLKLSFAEEIAATDDASVEEDEADKA